MIMSKVSILVPMYGVERYIRQCARSLFAQSYDNCEFIFVDDASIDRSLEQLKVEIASTPHRATQIRIIEQRINGGVAAARNTALDAATGDYILFVDADDWVEPELVDRLLQRASQTNADICNAWCESVTEHDERTPTPTIWLSGRHAHLRAILGQSHIVPNHIRGMLIRRSLLEDNALRFTPQVDFGEDYSLLPRALYYARKRSTLHEYLYQYRVENSGSYMNNIGERQVRNYIAAERIVSDFFNSTPSAKQLQRALTLGRVNIKKWIFRRGISPLTYDATLLRAEKIPAKYPLLRLYNSALNSCSSPLINLFSIVINLALFIRVKITLLVLLKGKRGSYGGPRLRHD
ncbi:MAG: glycosyltransferase family 2 protein [Rikenellaceae bacterium]